MVGGGGGGGGWRRQLGLHRKAKTAIKSTKVTRITNSYKHTMLIYKEK